MRWLLRSAHLRFGHAAVRVSNLMRPELCLGVRLLALDDRDRVFLVRHSYTPDLHLPGGAVDFGETCREAAEREAREEGNLVLAGPPELFHVYWNPIGNRRDHIVLFVARGARQSAPRAASLEIVAAGFHALDALPGRLADGTRRRLDEVLGGAPPSDRW
jgi:ADP-ribose pyrophosphatase YjhB (NUDIX family)